MAANAFSPQCTAGHTPKEGVEPPPYTALLPDSGPSAHPGVLNAAQGPPLPGRTIAQIPHAGGGWAAGPHYSPPPPPSHPHYTSPQHFAPSSQRVFVPYPQQAYHYGPRTPLSHQQMPFPYSVHTDQATANALARSRFIEAVLCAFGIYFAILVLVGAEALEDWGLFLLRLVGVEAVVRAPL
jgi:hypothetical protein